MISLLVCVHMHTCKCAHVYVFYSISKLRCCPWSIKNLKTGVIRKFCRIYGFRSQGFHCLPLSSKCLIPGSLGDKINVCAHMYFHKFIVSFEKECKYFINNKIHNIMLINFISCHFGVTFAKFAINFHNSITNNIIKIILQTIWWLFSSAKK